MTREQNLDKITRACHAANPRLLDLTFGCRIERLLTKTSSVDVTVLVAGHQLKNVGGVAECDYDFIDVLEGGEKLRLNRKAITYRILGHPITLPDVLMAAKKANVYMEVDSDGGINYDTDRGIQISNWDLSKSAADQSDETLEFLAQLL